MEKNLIVRNEKNALLKAIQMVLENEFNMMEDLQPKQPINQNDLITESIFTDNEKTIKVTLNYVFPEYIDESFDEYNASFQII